MGWQKVGKSKYYYRKYRVGNNVYSRYIGNGSIGDIAMEEDRLDRRSKRDEKQLREMKMKKELEIDRKADQVLERTITITNALLLIAGFHTYKGEWRKNGG